MITIVLGTRAELIKMFPVMRELEKRKLKFYFIHTGQHNINDLIRELNVKKPDFQLDNPKKVAGRFKNIFQAILWNIRIGFKLRKIVKKLNSRYILIQGDTMSTAMASIFMRTLIKRPIICHVEAGLRSGNIFEPFPEEICRRIADFFSDILFVPTTFAAKNLKKKKFVVVAGNTVIDAVKYATKKVKRKKDGDYIIAMIHRQENVRSKKRMEKFVEIIENLPFKIFLVLHPHSVESLKKFGLWKKIKENKKMKMIKLLTYFQFIKLLAKSKGIITDSGGLAEECCELKKPCLIFRARTERQEAIKVGIGKITINSSVKEIVDFLNKVPKKIRNPYGDGNSAKKIIDYLVT